MKELNDIITLIEQYKIAYQATYTSDKEKYLALRDIVSDILIKMDFVIKDLGQYEVTDYSIFFQTLVNLLT